MNAKLDTARVFERIFEIYRDQFTLLIPAALVVFVPVAVISGLIYAGDVGILGALIVAAIGTIATYWFQGMVVEAARDILDGRRDHTVGSLVRSVAPVIGPLVVAGILAGIAIGDRAAAADRAGPLPAHDLGGAGAGDRDRAPRRDRARSAAAASWSAATAGRSSA